MFGDVTANVTAETLLDRWVECRDPRRLLEDTYVKAIMGALEALRAP